LTPSIALLRRAALALCAAVGLISCGVGQDGTGLVPDAQTTGVVTGFGSVIVDGIRYDVDRADIRLDGASGARATDLRVGMVVTVTGALAADGASGTATEVRHDTLLDGPIEAVVGAQELRVLGQRVLADDTTVVAGASEFAALRAGDRVRLSGLRAPDGSLLATWVQRETVAAAPRLTGFVTAVGTGTVRVSGVLVDISAARLVGVTQGTLAAGQLVRLTLQAPPSGAAAVATELALIDLRLPDSVFKRQIQGIVDGWNAQAGRLVLGGQSVLIDARTQFIDGSANDLAVGLRIEVSGRLEAGRELRAERLRIRRAPLAAYGRGAVDSVDLAGRSFRLFAAPGVEVRLRAGTLFDDTSTEGPLSLARLQPGDQVLVFGRDGGTHIDADLVRRLPPRVPGAGIGGAVSEIAGTRLTILGMAVTTNALTTYFDAQDRPMTQAEFYTALRTGDLVRAEGAHVNGAISALTLRRVR
jgi:hypothetical protein